MAKKDIVKKIKAWCNYFINNPFIALYQKGDYKSYKETIETFNSFLARDTSHAPIDSEEVFKEKVEILDLLIKSEYLVYNRNNKK